MSASGDLEASDWGVYSRSQLLPKNWRVVRRWTHDSGAFTQGLFWRGDRIYEGTGMNGASRLRRVNILGGKWDVEAETTLDSKYFGEGIAIWTDRTAKWLPFRDNGTPREVIFQVRKRVIRVLSVCACRATCGVIAHMLTYTIEMRH